MKIGDTIKIIYKNPDYAGRSHCKNAICTDITEETIVWLFKEKNDYSYSWRKLEDLCCIPVKTILNEKIFFEKYKKKIGR